MRTGMRFVVAVACVLGVQAVVSCVDVEERTSRFCREHPEICDAEGGADAGAHDGGDAGDAGFDGGVDAGDAGPDGGPDAGDAGTPRWDWAGTPNTARTGHTATLLADGRVLVVGGFQNASGTGALTSVELYDPNNDGGTWTSLGALQVARGDHTATLISGGKVLVVGGRSGATPTKSVELYDPASGTSPRPDLPISARASHGAVLLPDGDEVLVMGGGANGETGLGDSARYAVLGGTWSTGSGSMLAERNVLSVTMVLNRVFAVGGYNANRTESNYDVYTPGEGWSAGGPLVEARNAHAAAVIGQGEAAAQLLITGGKRGDGAGSITALSSTELIPTEEGGGHTSIPLDTMFDARFAHTATTLESGDVLVVGGSEADHDSLSTVELFDSSLLDWVLRPPLKTARAGHTATLLPDGSVLVIGGHGSNGVALKSAERYWP